MEPLKKILLCLRNVFTKKDDSVIPTDFSDLAPLDSIDNTSEYLNALDWALKNRRIRNVALCGPYGAGKSKSYTDTLFPCVYDDYVGTAKQVLTSAHKEGLRHLLTFRFKKHPRYNLPNERLKLIEKVVAQRAIGLLTD